MQEIPVQIIPSQTVRAVLDGQDCRIKIYTKDQGCFVDVSADGVDVAIGTICRNAVPLVCRRYSGFQGNILFLDLQGDTDPVYTGFSSRYKLLYLTEAEYVLI